jgi:LPS-assembly protein
VTRWFWRAAFAAAVATTTVSAQVSIGGPLRVMAQVLQQQQVINSKAGQSQNPREPTGFPELPSKDGELPAPRKYGAQEKVLTILPGDTEWTMKAGHVHASNGVHAQYKGYDLYGDVLDGDTGTDVYTVTGHAKVVGVDQVITGEKVTIDYRHRSFVSQKSESDLKPSFFPSGSILGDVYVKGLDSFGSARELYGDYTELTTCNLPDPHFELISKKSDLRPHRRLILWDSQLWILKHHILTIPYLSIPLDSRSNPYTPEVGHSPDEGYYAKFRLPIALRSRDNFLDARIDEYSKLGQGLGLDYDYQNRVMKGMASVYHIFGGANDTEISVDHDEHFGRSELTFNTTYQKNNYLVANNSTLINTRAQFTIPQSNGSFDQISFSRNSNDSLGFTSIQQLYGFADTRVFSPALRSTLNLAYSDNFSSSVGSTNIDSKEVDVRFDATDDLKKAQAELQYMRNIPVGANNNTFFGVADQTPVVTLRTDSTRLMTPKLAAELPFQTDLSFGQYGTPSFSGLGAQHVTRANFDFDFTRPDHPDRRFDYTLNTRFQQAIYSDDAAQYVNGLDLGTRYNLGRDTAFNVHYDYLAQHGFSPLDFDRTGQNNLLTSDISLRPFRTFLVAAQTGYDFMAHLQDQPSFQDVGIKTEWNPRNYFQMRTLSTYDTTAKSISNIRVDFAYKPGATFLSAGFRYDGIQHKIGEVDLYVDAFKWGRLKTSMILDYDGYIKQFTAKHFSFTYDLHCAEAILQILDNPTGFRAGTQIGFYFRLKAFPFNTPFGVGTRGQAVGAGTGRDFY